MTKIIFDPRDQTILICEQDKDEMRFLGVPSDMKEGEYIIKRMDMEENEFEERHILKCPECGKQIKAKIKGEVSLYPELVSQE